MSRAVIHPDLLAEILSYCETEGVSKSQFGITAMKDPRLVYDLEQGRELRRKTEASLRETLDRLKSPREAAE